MMVICLRGPNGSGKSTLVRTIMSDYAHKEETRRSGRRQPTGYKLSGHVDPAMGPSLQLFVPGYYDPRDTAIGGTDTLRDLEELYDLVWHAYDAGFAVLFEGKSRIDGVVRLANMFHPGIARVVVIDHPLSECVLTVRSAGRNIKVETVQAHDRKLRQESEKMRLLGYEVDHLQRNAALEKVRSLLAIS